MALNTSGGNFMEKVNQFYQLKWQSVAVSGNCSPFVDLLTERLRYPVSLLLMSSSTAGSEKYFQQTSRAEQVG